MDSLGTPRPIAVQFNRFTYPILAIIAAIGLTTFWLCWDVLRPYLAAVLYASICATLLNEPFFVIYTELRLLFVRAIPVASRPPVLKKLFRAGVPAEFASAPESCIPVSILSLLHRVTFGGIRDSFERLLLAFRWTYLKDIGLLCAQAAVLLLLLSFRDSAADFRSAVWQLQATIAACIFAAAFGLSMFVSPSEASWLYIILQTSVVGALVTAVFILLFCYDFVITLAALSLLFVTCRGISQILRPTSVSWVSLARLLFLTLGWEILGPLWLALVLGIAFAFDVILVYIWGWCMRHASDAWIPSHVFTVGKRYRAWEAALATSVLAETKLDRLKRSAAWLAVGVSGALLGFVTLVVVVRVVSDVNTIATTQAAKIHLPEVNSSHVEEAKSWAVLGMESAREWALELTMNKSQALGFNQADVNKILALAPFMFNRSSDGLTQVVSFDHQLRGYLDIGMTQLRQSPVQLVENVYKTVSQNADVVHVVLAKTCSLLWDAIQVVIGPFIWLVIKQVMEWLHVLLATTAFFSTMLYLIPYGGTVLRSVPLASMDSEELQKFPVSVYRVLNFAIKTVVFHFLFNWVFYAVFGLTGYVGRCLVAMAASMSAILHILPVWMAAIPGALELWQLTGNPYIALAFLLVHMDVTGQGSELLMTELAGDLTINAFVIGMSVYCGGLVMLPGLRGILLGPIVLLLTVRLWRIVRRPPAPAIGDHEPTLSTIEAASNPDGYSAAGSAAQVFTAPSGTGTSGGSEKHKKKKSSGPAHKQSSDDELITHAILLNSSLSSSATERQDSRRSDFSEEYDRFPSFKPSVTGTPSTPAGSTISARVPESCQWVKPGKQRAGARATARQGLNGGDNNANVPAHRAPRYRPLSQQGRVLGPPQSLHVRMASDNEVTARRALFTPPENDDAVLRWVTPTPTKSQTSIPS